MSLSLNRREQAMYMLSETDICCKISPIHANIAALGLAEWKSVIQKSLDQEKSQWGEKSGRDRRDVASVR